MTERLPKNHDARAQIESLPLEGKVPSAHTGRMRWKSCVFDGSSCFFPVFTCHLISQPAAASFPSRGSLWSGACGHRALQAVKRPYGSDEVQRITNLSVSLWLTAPIGKGSLWSGHCQGGFACGGVFRQTEIVLYFWEKMGYNLYILFKEADLE